MAIKTSSKDAKKALRQAANKFGIYGSQISSTSKHITYTIAEELKHEIESNYENFKNKVEGEGDHQIRTMNVLIEPNSTGNTITVVGRQVIYDEFGTGVKGLSNPHPKKSNYNLQAYNSGSKIKHFPDMKKDYWSYYANGKIYRSHGIEPGQFVYDSFINVADNIAANIALKELLDDAKKVMKGK